MMQAGTQRVPQPRPAFVAGRASVQRPLLVRPRAVSTRSTGEL